MHAPDDQQLSASANRILIVDDNDAIHTDFRKVLAPERETADDAKAAFFGEQSQAVHVRQYELDSAYQGQQAYDMAVRAAKDGRPYAMAFVDVRMPPGWDGVETIQRIWSEVPELQVVVCTAYSDYSWDEMAQQLGHSDQFLILKKPFDVIEVRQAACALTTKWLLARQARLKLDELEQMVAERTATLTEVNRKLESEITLRRKAENHFRLVVEASPFAIITADADATIGLVNSETESLLGYERDELVGQPMTLLMPNGVPESRPDGLTAFLDDPQADRLDCARDLMVLHRDGHEIPVQTRLKRLDVEQGPTILMALMDISVRKQAEAQLQRAKEAAESANRAKSEFLANMSHEIRTPMNGILGMTQLALETDLTSEQCELLQMAKSSADSLLEIINDILDFSRIESGKLQFDIVEFSLRQCLVDTLRTMEMRAEAKGLVLAQHVSPDVPDALVGDPLRLRQVVINLVANAIKFTEIGEVVLRVTADPSHASDSVQLHFTVTDSGVGIPEDKLNSIFEAFTQADGSTTRQFGGTGLGLTICKQLVELMDGEIWAESEVGCGSTFHFIARFQRAVAGSRLPPPTSSAARVRSLVPPGLRVLLVEDDPVSRVLARRYLSRLDCQITLATNGEEAVALAGARPFDLVLMDVQMPTLDGFEATAAIRAQEGSSQGRLPILALTANAIKGDRERCLEAGMDGYVTKPVQEEQLHEAMLDVLSSTSQTTDSRTASAKPSRSVL